MTAAKVCADSGVQSDEEKKMWMDVTAEDIKRLRLTGTSTIWRIYIRGELRAVECWQWRRQDLLRKEALTANFRAGCSSCSMTNVTNAVLTEL